MAFLRVLDLSRSALSSLESVWWLDLELANSVTDKHTTKVFTLPDVLNMASRYENTSSVKHLLSIAKEIASSQDADQHIDKVLVRLVFGKVSGFAVRPDFMVYRLHGAECVTSAITFLTAFSGISEAYAERITTLKTLDDFIQLSTLAIGGVVSRTLSKAEETESLRRDLDEEFVKRLAVPWIMGQPLTQSRVFWVQGRADIESSRQFYEAARSLGIIIVVLDQPGHWLEDDHGPHAHYREAFIPVSVEGDQDLTRRIVDAVQSYPHKVDGIVTISDVRLPFVARACELLGLPTSLSASYFLAGDKGATRESEEAAMGKKEGFVLKTTADLDAILAQGTASIRYPLIVKPCMGWNSDCVMKVQNQDELYAAVNRASGRHANSPSRSTKVVVEPYIHGPEVDANFIILDGEILFCDISDDFPSLGDGTAGEVDITAANFMETLMDVPTNLPTEEKDVLKESLKGSIGRMGFRSGVFHCEARVRDSRAQYIQNADGIVDLHVPEKANSSKSPTCYLHEVNARPPGYINCVAAFLAYGVDYYAVRLLMSLGHRESQRIRLLAQPFLGGKPQYTIGVVVLPPTRSGKMASSDAVQDYLLANPALKGSVVHYQTLRQKGDYVEGPESSELLAVGYIIVASREGRQECLKLSKQIRDSFDYKLETDCQ